MSRATQFTGRCLMAGKATAAAKGSNGFVKLLDGKSFMKSGRVDYGEEHQIDLLTALHGGKCVKMLSAAVSMLVLPDLTQGTGAQKKAASLNNKANASIQIVDAGDVIKMLTPTDAQIVDAFRSGSETVRPLQMWLRFYRGS